MLEMYLHCLSFQVSGIVADAAVYGTPTFVALFLYRSEQELYLALAQMDICSPWGLPYF